MEESGRARRGYFVDGLGAAQFALPGAVDRLRGFATPSGPRDEPGTWAWSEPVPRTRSGNGMEPGGVPVPRDRPGDRRVPGGEPGAVLLAATDPANPYGAALEWPQRAADAGTAMHRPGRKSGALVVLVEGELTLYVERGGKSLLTFSDDLSRLQPAADALALAVHDGALGKLAVERVDGDSVLSTPVAVALRAAGFHATPRGLRLRG
jgi:ATP-dependent Lhr-like helicase